MRRAKETDNPTYLSGPPYASKECLQRAWRRRVFSQLVQKLQLVRLFLLTLLPLLTERDFHSSKLKKLLDKLKNCHSSAASVCWLSLVSVPMLMLLFEVLSLSSLNHYL